MAQTSAPPRTGKTASQAPGKPAPSPKASGKKKTKAADMLPYAAVAAIIPGAMAKKAAIALLVLIGIPYGGQVAVHTIVRAHMQALAELESQKEDNSKRPNRQAVEIEAISDLEDALRNAKLLSEQVLEKKLSGLAEERIREDNLLIGQATKNFANYHIPDAETHPVEHQKGEEKLARAKAYTESLKTLVTELSVMP